MRLVQEKASDLFHLAVTAQECKSGQKLCFMCAHLDQTALLEVGVQTGRLVGKFDRNRSLILENKKSIPETAG